MARAACEFSRTSRYGRGRVRSLVYFCQSKIEEIFDLQLVIKTKWTLENPFSELTLIKIKFRIRPLLE